eukprot:2972997-Amphidinium_carterae.1
MRIDAMVNFMGWAFNGGYPKTSCAVAWAVLGILGLVADLHMLLGAITPRLASKTQRRVMRIADNFGKVVGARLKSARRFRNPI